VQDPGVFVALLRSCLAPGGVLVLSTPDAGVIAPETAQSTLGPVLSLGNHLVLQTADSLEWLLRRAGFTDVAIQSGGMSLIAYASDQPLPAAPDVTARRSAYLGYLVRRLANTQEESDLWLGLAARLYLAAVQEGDWPQADRVFPDLARVIGRRFGLDLDAADAYPTLATAGTPDAWMRKAPFCLPPLLHARAIHQTQQGADVIAVAARLAGIAELAGHLRRVLLQMNADDPLIERIERLTSDEFVQHAVVKAVNAGGYDAARSILARYGRPILGPPEGEQQTAETRDLLFALGMLDLQPGGDLGRAASRFARIRAGIAPDTARLPDSEAAHYWAALQGELQASEMAGDEARERALFALLPVNPPIPAELRRMHVMFLRRQTPLARIKRKVRGLLPKSG
jgi:hypothetical protein